MLAHARRVPTGKIGTDAVELAFRHDRTVLVEEMITGREVELGVLGNSDPLVSPPGEIVIANDSDWYDYSAKYDEGAMRLQVPAELPDSVTAELQDVARRAFEVCGCSGMARIDFFVTPEHRVVLNEINTIPGFTATSVYAELFEKSGVPAAADPAAADVAESVPILATA